MDHSELTTHLTVSRLLAVNIPVVSAVLKDLPADFIPHRTLRRRGRSYDRKRKFVPMSHDDDGKSPKKSKDDRPLSRPVRRYLKRKTEGSDARFFKLAPGGVALYNNCSGPRAVCKAKTTYVNLSRSHLVHALDDEVKAMLPKDLSLSGDEVQTFLYKSFPHDPVAPVTLYTKLGLVTTPAVASPFDWDHPTSYFKTTNPTSTILSVESEIATPPGRRLSYRDEAYILSHKNLPVYPRDAPDVYYQANYSGHVRVFDITLTSRKAGKGTGHGRVGSDVKGLLKDLRKGDYQCPPQDMFYKDCIVLRGKLATPYINLIGGSVVRRAGEASGLKRPFFSSVTPEFTKVVDQLSTELEQEDWTHRPVLVRIAGTVIGSGAPRDADVVTLKTTKACGRASFPAGRVNGGFFDYGKGVYRFSGFVDARVLLCVAGKVPIVERDGIPEIECCVANAKCSFRILPL